MKNTSRILGGNSLRTRAQHGTATVELAILLPLMLIILFVIVDIGRLLDARFALVKLAQQGGLLGSRDVMTPAALSTLLQKAASPLDLVNSGKIYIWRITGGTSTSVKPKIDTGNSGQTSGYGALSVSSTIGTGTGYPTLGLYTTKLYDRLTYSNGTTEISEVTVVEVFYKYQPITPLSQLIPGLLTDNAGGFIISSRAVFP